MISLSLSLSLFFCTINPIRDATYVWTRNERRKTRFDLSKWSPLLHGVMLKCKKLHIIRCAICVVKSTSRRLSRHKLLKGFTGLEMFISLLHISIDSLRSFFLRKNVTQDSLLVVYTSAHDRRPRAQVVCAAAAAVANEGDDGCAARIRHFRLNERRIEGKKREVKFSVCMPFFSFSSHRVIKLNIHSFWLSMSSLNAKFTWATAALLYNCRKWTTADFLLVRICAFLILIAHFLMSSRSRMIREKRRWMELNLTV